MKDQSGFTVIELGVAAFISLVVFGATLTAFEGLVRQNKATERQSALETQARQGVDRLARQLRNLASPADIITDIAASTQPKSIDRNRAHDVIFKDVGETRPAGSLNSANVRRARYCLQTSGAVPGTAFTASETRGVLWMQTQTWTTATPPAMPADLACPGAGWTTQTIVADNVTNSDAGRSTFRYSGDEGQVTGSQAADRDKIARVQAQLLVDEDPLTRPDAAEIQTSVMLRNQNRAPIAAFSWSQSNIVPPCSIQLNGSASEDPESKPLEYQWWIDGVDIQQDGVVVQHSVAAGSHTYQLKVYDRAHLVGESAVETHVC
jgi:Tfp pilus assembly protein PilE